MRWKRSLPLVLAVLAVAATLVAVVQLRRRAPPEPARLLPGADGFLYVNLRWLRTLKAIGELPTVSHDPEYDRFIQETGFQFERDLDEAAFAIHYPSSWAKDGTGGPVPRPRMSEVFVGKIDGQRITTYLRKRAASVENYHSVEIYNLRDEDSTFRVAVLNVDSVAISNHDDPALIHGMVDRAHKLASPFGGPAMLRQYFKALPVVSKTLPVVKLAWFIGRVEPSAQADLGAWSTLFEKPTTLVVSAYCPLYSPSLHLRAEAFAANAEDAQMLSDKVSTYLTLFHAAELAVASKGGDPDLRSFFDSLDIKHQDDRAILTAAVPPGLLRKVVTEQSGETVPSERPATEPAHSAPRGSSVKSSN